MVRAHRKLSLSLPVCWTGWGHVYAQETKSYISLCPRDCKSGQGPWNGGTWFLLLGEVKGPCRAGRH